MFIEALLYSFVGLISGVLVVTYCRKTKNRGDTSLEALNKAFETGLTEPVSLHPKIDPTSCISAGACVTACPEGEVLGIVNGRAELISPTKCIGHGACQEACPADAIELVFGTERRGLDIPNVNERFETNVPGMFIAGELGGMGLIRNAVTQGREAVEYIAESGAKNTRKKSSVADLLIVGAGPAGLSATLQARKSGLNYITVEQDDFGGAALSYPRQKVVMTQPMEIPLFGRFKQKKILKEELLKLWNDLIKKNDIKVSTGEKVEEVTRTNGHFTVKTTKQTYEAKNILLAIGRRGTPRKLGVPGEQSSKVTYKLLEPEQYVDKHSLVVGGGNAAAEAAVTLSEQRGTVVTLSCRGTVLQAANEENRAKIEEAVSKGRLTVHYNCNVAEILPDAVVLDIDGKTKRIDNDYVFVFIGGILPTKFLNDLGIQVEKKFGER